MGVDHRCAHIFVSEQLLHGADVVAFLEQMGGEGMAESVGADRFVDVCQAGCLLDRALDAGFMDMVPPNDARTRVG